MRDPEESQIRVNDRRRYNIDGTKRLDANDQVETAAAPLPIPPPASPKKTEKTSDTPESQGGIDFGSFLMSLASSVQIALGLVPHPQTGQPILNLASAKQTIDVLAMLQEKTKGNLTAEEAKLIQQLVYELRMIYVQVNQSIANQAKTAL